MNVNLAAPTISKAFPAGTADTDFSFAITGTLADGTAFSDVVTSTGPSVAYTLNPGTYTVKVSKLGVVSQPSLPFAVADTTTVTFTVPDPVQAATITAV